MSGTERSIENVLMERFFKVLQYTYIPSFIYHLYSLHRFKRRTASAGALPKVRQ